VNKKPKSLTSYKKGTTASTRRQWNVELPRKCSLTGYAWGVVKRHWHDLFIMYLYLIYACDMSYAYERCDSSICLYLISCVCHESFTCVTCWFPICGGTHSKVWNYLLISWLRHDWLIPMSDRTHSYVWRDPFICTLTGSYVWRGWRMCVSGLIRMWSVTYSCVWHASFIRMICLIHMYATWLSHTWTWLSHTCNKTHSCLCHDWFAST